MILRPVDLGSQHSSKPVFLGARFGLLLWTRISVAVLLFRIGIVKIVMAMLRLACVVVEF